MRCCRCDEPIALPKSRPEIKQTIKLLPPHHRSFCSPELAVAIYQAVGTHSEIADQFDVKYDIVWNIREGRTYRKVIEHALKNGAV